VFSEAIRLRLDGIDGSQILTLKIFGEQFEVSGRGEDLNHFQAVALVGNPDRRIVTAKVNGDRVGPQGLLAFEHILRKEGEGEFT
jgi:hypothetical protein